MSNTVFDAVFFSGKLTVPFSPNQTKTHQLWASHARPCWPPHPIAQKYRRPSKEVLARIPSWLEAALMKPMMRQASVLWTGGDGDGSGAMTTESGVLKQTRYSSSAPFKKHSGTNPAELIAAAHAGSFSMALAHELGLAGFVPNHIATIATVTLERLAAGWMMTNINLKVLAKVPKAAQGDFIDATLRAKTGCPISRLLRANVSMNAKLESNAPAVGLPRPPNQNHNPPVRSNRTGSRKPKRLRHL